MTVTTTTHADWSGHPEDLPVTHSAVDGWHARVSGDRGTESAELTQRMQMLMSATVPTMGDPTARARMAAAMHELTGWAVFAEDDADQRAYVSRLWAEDWDSAEDAAYDER